MRGRLLIGLLALSAIIVIAVVLTRGAGNASPPAELSFIKGMQPIMAQVQNPQGADLASWRQQRATMICSVITNLTVTDWTGTVDKVDSSIAGGAIVSIAVMPAVDFGTAPNALANVASNTLISQGSPLYQTISTLQVGQKVKFSGQLFSSPDDCIQEASVTQDGSMQNPLFVTRFTSLTPLPHTDN